MANESIAKDTILIFDEPENHVHPKWQLKMAQMLLKLVEDGVYVMVASHSPYLVEALKRGVDRAGLASESRFALAQKNKIQDEDCLSDIFENYFFLRKNINCKNEEYKNYFIHSFNLTIVILKIKFNHDVIDINVISDRYYFHNIVIKYISSYL
jgi:ABC-type multidrug transport system ATPase subunit